MIVRNSGKTQTFKLFLKNILIINFENIAPPLPSFVDKLLNPRSDGRLLLNIDRFQNVSAARCRNGTGCSFEILLLSSMLCGYGIRCLLCHTTIAQRQVSTNRQNVFSQQKKIRKNFPTNKNASEKNIAI